MEYGKKKDKYQGGLVFEPETGLYDKIVHFKLCFTTVERSNLKDENTAPEAKMNGKGEKKKNNWFLYSNSMLNCIA